MAFFIESHLERKDIELYNQALSHGDSEWLAAFWDDLSDRTGCSKRKLLDAILDDFNEQRIGKTNRDYYLSNLARQMK